MMFLKRSLVLGNIALAITAGAALQAQEVTGAMVGTVKDSKGSPVNGAEVLIRSAKMIAPRRVITDEKGNFRAPLLPPGEYQVDVTRGGFAGQGARNIRVSIGANIRQDFTLRPIEMASTTVEVIATAAAADKTDTKAATSLSSEELLVIPTSGGDRAFAGAMDLAPGVATNSGGGTSIRGGKTQETAYTLNGTSIKDDYEGRMNTTRLIDDAVEDTQVVQSSLHARFGRSSGGTVNVVTKSGGNDFSGSIRTYVSRDDWQVLRHNESPQNSSGRANKYSQRQFDVFFSGPIWKDRIWFAVSTIQKPKESSRDTILNGLTPAEWLPGTPTGEDWSAFDPTFKKHTTLYAYDLGKSIVSEQTQKYIDAKFTGAITPDHTVEFVFQQNKNISTNVNPYGSPIVATLGSNSFDYVGLEKYWSYAYRGVIGGNRFIEARYSKSIAHTLFPAPPLDHMRLSYNDENNVQFPYGFNLSPKLDQRDNHSGSINYKHFFEAAGSHEFDAGFEFYEFLRVTNTQFGGGNQIFFVPAACGDPSVIGGLPIAPDYWGNVVGFQAVNFYQALDAGVDAQTYTGPFGQSAVLRKYYGQDGLTKTRTTSYYVNDSWAINPHFNLMLGLRVDKFRVKDTDGTTFLSKMGPLSPRLQFRYDPDGTAKHLFTLTAAKYVTEFSAGWFNTHVKTARLSYAQYGYTGVANAPGTATWVDYANIINPMNYGNSPDGLAGGLSTPTAFANTAVTQLKDDFKNPYVWEYTLGYRRSYQNGSYFQITLVDKDWKNSFSRYQQIDPSFVVMVGDPRGTNTPAKAVLGTRFGNSNELKRKYKAAELDFSHIINSVWSLGGGYTYSHLAGNDNGGDNPDQGFYSSGLSAPLHLSQWHAQNGTPGEMYNAHGLLLSDQTHKGRLYLAASLPLGKGRISYSAMLRYDSSARWGASGAMRLPNHTAIPKADGATIPTYPTTFTAWATRRGAFSEDDYYRVDAKIDWTMPLRGKLSMMGYVQVENVFNTQMRFGYSRDMAAGVNAYSTTPVLKVQNPEIFGTDAGSYLHWMSPRRVRASIGLKF